MSTAWQPMKKYRGLGPAEASGRMDRDEILERFDRLERRVDEFQDPTAPHRGPTRQNPTGNVTAVSDDHSDEPDLAAIEAELDGVQAALTRLADGTYWTDEVTGNTIADEVLAAAPLTRRA